MDYNTESIQVIKAAREDFKIFLTLVWHHLQLPTPTVVQLDIADELQRERSIIIHALRGEGKSWITAAYVLWRLWRDPQKKFLVVSATGSKAFEFSTFTKRLIYEMPLLAELRPRQGQRDSVIAFDVGPARAAQAPSIKSVGINGQITGSRADEIVADDVEVLTNSATPDQRQKLLKAIEEFPSVLMPGGLIKFLGTPQSIESIYNELEKRGTKRIFWPSRIPEQTRMEVYGNNLGPCVQRLIDRGSPPGTPVDAERFTDQVLRDKEAQMGHSTFMLQFQLDTSLSDAEKYPLKTSDLIIFPLDNKVAPPKICWAGIADCQIKTIPGVGFSGDRWYAPFYKSKEFTDYMGTVMTVDPSGHGNDLTSYAVVKQLNGMLFVMEVGGFPGGYSDSTMARLAEKAHYYGVNEIVIESNFGDGMFTKLFQPILGKVHPCTVSEVRNTKQKELRIIDTLEPLFNQHRMVFDQTFVEREARAAYTVDDSSVKAEDRLAHNLFYQITRITKDRGSLLHDDKIDALAMACGYFVEAMAQDVEDRLKELEDARIDEELRRFAEEVNGPGIFTLYDPKRDADVGPLAGRKFF